jgi:site-specific DNA recombinase
MTTMDEGLRVIIAARLSQKRKGRDGIGLETQDERSRPWAEAQGYHVVATVADTARGTVPPFKRKNLAAWVTDPAKMAEYDAIVAYRNDRLSRAGWRDEAAIRAWAEDHGKRLVIVDGPQWPPRNDGDRWQWESMSIQARKEWEASQERNDRMQRAILDNGGFVGAPPWGWVLVGEEYAKQPVATDQARVIMPEMFRMLWQDKASTRDIALWLETATWPGVPFVIAGWHPQTVTAMIRNRMYAGHVIHAMPAYLDRPAQTWDTPCEELVDPESWDRANRELDARAAKAAGGRKPGTRSKTLLAGVARCPRCAVRGKDSPMTRITARQGVFQRCRGRGGASAMKGCGNMVPASAAESLMNRFMRGNQTEILTVTRKPPTDYDSAVRKAKNARKALDDDAPDYDQRYAELTVEVKRAEAERDAHQGEKPVTEITGTGVTYAQRWAGLDDTGRGDWLRKSGVLAYYDTGDWDAGAVLAASGEQWAKVLRTGPGLDESDGSNWVRVSGDPGWAKVLRDDETGVAVVIVWNPDF